MYVTFNFQIYCTTHLKVLLPSKQLHGKIPVCVVNRGALVHNCPDLLCQQQSLSYDVLERLKVLLEVEVDDVADDGETRDPFFTFRQDCFDEIVGGPILDGEIK